MINRPPDEQDLNLAAHILADVADSIGEVQREGVLIVAEFLSMLAPQMEMLTAMMPPIE